MADDTTGREGRMDKPAPPAEGPLIRLVRLGARMSAQQAANAAGISKARWSQVENGYEKRQDGLYYPVHATDGLLARMAQAVGLDAARLEQAGRGDAAAVLREMIARDRRDEPDRDAPLEPECEFERRLLARLAREMPDLPDDAKRIMLQAHRSLGHSDICQRPADEDERLAGLTARSA